MDRTPVYRVNVVSRNVKAVNYRHREGSTKVDFRGTELMPRATGKAEVESKSGRTVVDAKFEHLQPANTLGLEYLTYVLWAITPEGRAKNLGEILLDDGKGGMRVTTDLQAFGLILTAEPYFAVTEPSDLVVAENVVRSDTKGTEEPITARYELLPRGLYAATNEPIRDIVYGVDKKTPRDLVEARNALRIARAAQADRYASGSFHKAEQLLDQAEDYYRRRQSKNSIATAAREAAQTAEEARVMALKGQEQERIEAERRNAAERELQARAKADEEGQRRAQAEVEAARAEQAKAEADRVKLEAEAATQQAQQERERAEAAKSEALVQQQASEAEAQRARMSAQQAEQARLQAEQDREQIRARLLEQLNQVLQTKDTARGLIVNMSDVLFDTGQSTLKPGARERLAKVAGIILAYPDLKLQVEGHTDSVGGDEFNQRLSEQRAASVRAYLVTHGVSPDHVVATGFGKTQPIASNNTAAGRQLNRRVELVVSGEAIGAGMNRGTPGQVPGAATGGTAGTATTTPAGTQMTPGTATSPASVGAPSGTQPIAPAAPTTSTPPPKTDELRPH
jgi:outer membrane protein OmpA-like peptidoglycan-associated protein